MSKDRKMHAFDKDLAEALGTFQKKKKRETGRDLGIDETIKELGRNDPEFSRILEEKEKEKGDKISLSDLI